MPNCSIPLLSHSECLTRCFLSSSVVGATSMSGFPFVVRVCIVRIDMQQTRLRQWLPLNSCVLVADKCKVAQSRLCFQLPRLSQASVNRLHADLVSPVGHFAPAITVQIAKK
jgi:hypothetical protein